MRARPPGWLLPLLLLFASLGVCAQSRPLVGPDAEFLPAGTLRVEGGVEFLHDVNYLLSGLRGDQTNVGVVNLRLGVAENVEAQLTGAIRQFLEINSRGPSFVDLNLPSADSTSDVGDFSLFTKARILREGRRRPALALRLGVTLPNTDQARGIGTNTLRASTQLILERHFGRLQTFGHAGLGIFTAPNATGTQNDVLLYGASFAYPAGGAVELVGEVAGHHSARTITPELVGTESRAQGRFGLRFQVGAFVIDAAGIAGVYAHDPRAGFTFGVSREFRLLRRDEP